MATIELFTPAAHLDGWRKVFAPGGYECWRFAAASSDGSLQLIAGLHLGWAGDAGYVRRYRKFEAFPTRVSPPAPAEHLGVSLIVIRNDGVVCRMYQRVHPAEFSASTDAGKARMGGSHVDTAKDGTIHVGIRGLMRERTVTADLVFRPKRAEVCDPADVIDDGSNHVALVAPLCDVDGEVDVFDLQAGGPRVIDLEGRGCHTHCFGTRMPGGGLSAAAAFVDGRAVLMHGFGGSVHRGDVTVERCEKNHLVVKEQRQPFVFTDVDVAFAPPHSLETGLAVCDVSIGGISTKALIETVRPSGFLRALLG